MVTTSLCNFDQEQGFVFDLGRHGYRNDHFEYAVIHGGCSILQFDGNLRGFAHQERLRRIGNFQGEVLDVNLLDAKHGLL